MSKKVVIWVIIILLAVAGGIYLYVTSTPVGPIISSGGTDITSPAATDEMPRVVPNAVIPQPTSTAGQAPVFEQAPPGTERGGKNPPVTDKPVVNGEEGSAPSTTPYKPPVTDRPVVSS